MSYNIVSSLKAEKDIVNIIEWYAEINKILAIRFFKELILTKDRISLNPKSYQIKYKTVRIAFLNKFPYGVHFIVNENTITILAVFHTSRNPKQ